MKLTILLLLLCGTAPAAWGWSNHTVGSYLALQALPALAPMAITALASVCMVQAWLLWQAPAAPVEQLSWRGAPGAAAPQASLRVKFLPHASMEQVAAALEQAQAGIVAGPLPDRSYLLDAADPQAALRSLQASGVAGEASRVDARTAP